MRRKNRKNVVRVGLVGSAVAIAGVASGCVYNTPTVGAASQFNDVATISKNDVWAVGDTASALGSPTRSLIEHFDGSNWKVVTPPSSAGSSLTSVTAISASDVWAVGAGHTLHWNGSTWSATADPTGLVVAKVEHGHGGALMGLGVNTSSGQEEVLTRTANSWQPIATPTPPLPTSGRSCDDVLFVNAMTFLTPNDVWVAGATRNSGNTVTNECPYAAHWNGSTWTTYSPPNATGQDISALAAISARADGTVWAVGEGHFVDQQSGAERNPGFADRWNGTSWQSLCNFGCAAVSFTDIDATGTNVWAVGTELEGTGVGNLMAISRWAGNGWVSQPVQQIFHAPLGFPDNILTGVSARGGLVAAGGFFLGINAANNSTTATPLMDMRSDG